MRAMSGWGLTEAENDQSINEMLEEKCLFSGDLMPSGVVDRMRELSLAQIQWQRVYP